MSLINRQIPLALIKRQPNVTRYESEILLLTPHPTSVISDHRSHQAQHRWPEFVQLQMALTFVANAM